jgi:hypothetical protein
MTKLLIESSCKTSQGEWLQKTYGKSGGKKKLKSDKRTHNIVMWLKYSWTFEWKNLWKTKEADQKGKQA